MPDLDFGVLDGEVLPYAAAPTILFKLRLSNAVEGEHIHSIMLRAQIRIEVTRRQYDARAEEQLLELFGERQRWGETLRTFLWTHATAFIPPFTGSSVAELLVTCTYDFDVAATKYLSALGDGEVPLLFLFSGTVFYSVPDGSLQIAQIPWEKEAQYRMPARVWRETMDHYFPNSAWIRLRRDVFEELRAWKARRALPTWEAALEDLLRRFEARVEG